MSRTATVILAIVCVAAGAGGSFLALRSDSPVTATEQVQAPASALSAVAESEGVIEPVPVAVPAAPVVAEPAPRPRRPVQAPPAPRPSVRQTASASRVPEPPVPAPPAFAPDQRVVPIAPAAITDNQASRTVEPPAPLYEELVVAADSVIGLLLESPVTSERAQVEDSVVARVTRDVKVGDRVRDSGGREGAWRSDVGRGAAARCVSVHVLASSSRLSSLRMERDCRCTPRRSFAKATLPDVRAQRRSVVEPSEARSSEAFWVARRVRRLVDCIGAGAGTAAVVAGDRNHATLSAGTPLTVQD